MDKRSPRKRAEAWVRDHWSRFMDDDGEVDQEALVGSWADDHDVNTLADDHEIRAIVRGVAEEECPA